MITEPLNENLLDETVIKKRNPALETTQGYLRGDGIMPNRSPELLGRNRSGSDSWATPWWLFYWLDEIFGFTLDVAAHANNHKCQRYYASGEFRDIDKTALAFNGLEQSWHGETVFCNPVYADLAGSKNILGWAEKCDREYRHGQGKTTIVMLIPARLHRRYFYQFLAGHDVWIFDDTIPFLHPGDNKPRRDNPSAMKLVVMSRDDTYLQYLEECRNTDVRSFQSLRVSEILDWWNEISEICEGCGHELPYEMMKPDAEGVNLCPDCYQTLLEEE